MVQLFHPIRVVSRLTGLSPHVIRVWEKRYTAVKPTRTKTKRRLYSDEDVQRLRLLGRATEGGHKIGIIAQLGLEDLRRLVASLTTGPDRPRSSHVHPPVVPTPAKPAREARSSEQADAQWVADALDGTRSFRADQLLGALERSSVRLGFSGVLHRVVAPLAEEIGELWQRGEITAAQEHFASAIVREFLTRGARRYAIEEHAPCAIVATPAGQLHELGALMVSAAAANLGWRTVYLGASLPAAEIAGAALQNEARAVLLSLVYPADDRHLPGDLALLRRLLPARTEIVAGGRAVRSYAATLTEIGAVALDGLEDLCDHLQSMRTSRPPHD